MRQNKINFEQALNNYFTAKQYYEYAIDNQEDLKEVVDNLEKYDQIAFEEADKFYEELRKNEQNLSDEDLTECWKLYRKYFEE